MKILLLVVIISTCAWTQVQQVSLGFTNQFLAINNIGDVDGNSVMDLVLSSPNDSAIGAFWILLMNTDNTILSSHKVNASMFPTLANFTPYFGYSIAYLGDFDGNSNTLDFAIGAPGYIFGSGALLIVHLDNVNFTPVRYTIFSANNNTGQLPEIPFRNNYFGLQIVNFGDYNLDGVPDLAVSLPGRLEENWNDGDIWVLGMNNDDTIKGNVQINMYDGNFLSSYSGGDSLGLSMAAIGDVDGDGIGDLAVGSYESMFYIVFLQSDGSVKESVEIDGKYSFGSIVYSAGDLNSDSVPDVMVPQTDNYNPHGYLTFIFLNRDGTEYDRARVYAEDIFSGKTYHLSHIDSKWNINLVNVMGIVEGNIKLVVTTASELYFVTIPGYQSNNYTRSTQSPSPIPPVKKFTPYPTLEFTKINSLHYMNEIDLSAYNKFGYSVTTIGDLDNNGYFDLIVGVDCDSHYYNCIGGFWLLYMDKIGTSYTLLKSKLLNTTQLIVSNPPTYDFGHSVCSISDMDGDSIRELVYGISGDGGIEPNSGGIVIVFIDNNGDVKNILPINDSTPGFYRAINEYENFGQSLANMGDMDNDGFDEIAVGSLINERDDSGAVYILFMGVNGTVKRYHRISRFSGDFTGGDDTIYMSRSIANVGDVDGDGINDLAAGTKISDSGNVVLFFLNSDGSVKQYVEVFSASSNDDNAGASVYGIGDFNGDTVPDIAVGFPHDNPTSRDDYAGGVYIFLLNRDGTANDSYAINRKYSSISSEIRPDSEFGSSLCVLPDINNDGLPEIVVGARYENAGDHKVGTVWILYLPKFPVQSIKPPDIVPNNTIVPNSDISVSDFFKISYKHSLQAFSLSKNSYFGCSVVDIGDLDGNGFSDLAVGACGDTFYVNSTLYYYNYGSVFIIFMGPNSTLLSYKKIDRSSHPDLDILMPNTSGVYFGNALTVFPDLNNDTVQELIVGAYGNGDYDNPSSIYILFLNMDGSVCDVRIINDLVPWFHLSYNSEFGNSLAVLSDMDGDSIPELAVGTPYDADSNRAGAIYILFFSTFGSLHDVKKISQNWGDMRFFLDSDARFGTAVANIGDFDNNGVDDIVCSLFYSEDDIPCLMLLLLYQNSTVKYHVINCDIFYQSYGYYSITNIGDVNGDGVVDIAVGLPFDDYESLGTVYIVLLEKDFSVLWVDSIHGHTYTNGFTNELWDDYYFGCSLSFVTNSIPPQIYVGSYGDVEGFPSAGSVWGLTLNLTSTFNITDPLLDYMTNDSYYQRTIETAKYISNFKTLSLTPWDALEWGWDVYSSNYYTLPNPLPDQIYFGKSIVYNDINGDGNKDLIVGAVDYLDGAIMIFFMDSNAKIEGIQVLAPGLNGFPSNLYGTYIFNTMSDLDNDGILELIVGSSGYDTPNSESGALYLFFLNSDGSIKDMRLLTPFFVELPEDSWFGDSVVEIGDIDGDGKPEIATVTTGDDDSGWDNGAIWILFLDNDFNVKKESKIAAFNNVSEDDDDWWNIGWQGGLSVIGDWDCNGVNDLLVGNNHNEKIFVYLLNSDGSAKAILDVETPPVDMDGYGAGALTLIGDINSDGVNDFAVSAYDTSVFNKEKGGGFLIMMMNQDLTLKDWSFISAEMHPFYGLIGSPSNFGRALAPAGDFFGDGIPDIIVGCEYYTPWYWATGGLFVVNIDGISQENKPPPTCTANIPLPPYVITVPGSDPQRVLMDMGRKDFSWEDANEQCTSQGKMMCRHQHYCPRGPFFPPIFNTLSGNVWAPIGDEIDNWVQVGSGDNSTESASTCWVYTQLDDNTRHRPLNWSRNTNTSYEWKGPYMCCDIPIVKMIRTSTDLYGLDLSSYSSDDLSGSHYFGSRMASLGDVDGDGVPDIIVGSSRLYFILFMERDGTVKRQGYGHYPDYINDDWSDTSIHFTGIDDFDGDGIPDYVLYANNYKEFAIVTLTKKGYINNTFIFDSSTISSKVKLSSIRSVSKSYDLNGDGISEIIMGDSSHLYIFFITRKGYIESVSKIYPNMICTIESGSVVCCDSFNFGSSSIRALPDLDGDNIPDIAFGINSDTDTGEVWILFMQSSGFPKNNSIRIKPNKTLMTNGLVWYPNTTIGDLFGEGVEWLPKCGQISGDDCLLVTAPKDNDHWDSNFYYIGAFYRLWLNFSNPVGIIENWDKVRNTRDELNQPLIRQRGTKLGYTIATLGDLDGDTAVEIVVSGEPRLPSYYQGGMFVFYITDVNECDEQIDDCATFATCSDKFDGYACYCLPGFDGNGQWCKDINECNIYNCSLSDPYLRCQNTNGSFGCVCESCLGTGCIGLDTGCADNNITIENQDIDLNGDIIIIGQLTVLNSSISFSGNVQIDSVSLDSAKFSVNNSDLTISYNIKIHNSSLVLSYNSDLDLSNLTITNSVLTIQVPFNDTNPIVINYSNINGTFKSINVETSEKNTYCPTAFGNYTKSQLVVFLQFPTCEDDDDLLTSPFWFLPSVISGSVLGLIILIGVIALLVRKKKLSNTTERIRQMSTIKNH